MSDAEEQNRQLLHDLIRLERIIDSGTVTSITTSRMTNNPLPVFMTWAKADGKTHGPYLVMRSEMIRLLTVAGLDSALSPETIGPGQVIRFDRKR